MFDEEIHVIFNAIWNFQTLLALVACVHHKFNMPSAVKRWSELPVPIRQFRLLLISHGVMYIAELFLTSMIAQFPSMAMHHYFSMVIFAVTMHQPHMVCTASLIPYYLHTLYWAFGAEDEWIVWLYNIYFYGVGIYAGVVYRKRAVTWLLLPMLCVVVPTVNYYSNCVFYEGSMCYDATPATNFLICIGNLLIVAGSIKML